MSTVLGRSVGWLAFGAATALLGAAAGCGDEVNVLGPGSGGNGQGGAGLTNTGLGGTGAGPVGGSTPGCAVPAERVDLLLSIDNSRSMADKQQVLALTVPDLVGGLVNPPCLRPDGTPAQAQPASSSEACPEPGSVRAFAPVVDLHVGVVSSSLGDHGGDVCPSDMGLNDDQAHLLSRDSGGGALPTYQNLGFLAWDPSQSLVPPGEGDPAALGARLTDILTGTGETGCGFESQLESWYRFLIDPDPYESIEETGGQAVPMGTDTVVLEQRKVFLRPDSLVLLLMLSDENDCSGRDGGQYFYMAKAQSGASSYHLPRAQITCQTDPADDCCRSCGQSDEGCPPKGDECDTAHDNLSDAINLRCYDQKRRFGIDFLYPIDRYVTGLTAAEVADREGNIVPNPLYTDLDPSDGISGSRDPSRVFAAGIVGVPWQLIARRDAGGNPDLLNGLDANGVVRGGYQSAMELQLNGAWSAIVGDFANYGPPTDPHMIESVEVRGGLMGPTAGYLADPIHGHDRTIGSRDDLQHACIFPLLSPRDCSTNPAPNACDCIDPNNDNALCEQPDGSNGQTQYFAKAYPSVRELELLRQLSGQGIVASICPSQLSDAGSLTYAYRPAARGILEAVTNCL